MTTTEPSTTDHVIEIEETKACIWRYMQGRDPSGQGAIIADMLATWLVGHAPPLRDAALTYTIELTMSLLPINEAILFEGAGHPHTWEKPDGENL
ncbi:hypothetical protein I6F26_10480 [Ensifer sp. IC3342]|nr:hypothetical protein [Ensifer sp. BRP08]MCA1447005.1 hypothetical protein [Ensifer sp. IC3342]